MEVIQLEESCKERLSFEAINWEHFTKQISKNPLDYIFLVTQEELTCLYKHITTVMRAIKEHNTDILSSIAQIDKDDMMPGLAIIVASPTFIPSMQPYTVAISNTGVVYFALRGHEKDRVPEVNQILEHNKELKKRSTRFN